MQDYEPPVKLLSDTKKNISEMFNFIQHTDSCIILGTTKEELVEDAAKCIKLLPLIGQSLREYIQNVNNFEGDFKKVAKKPNPTLDDLLASI